MTGRRGAASVRVVYLDEAGPEMQRLLEAHKPEGVDLGFYSAAEGEEDCRSMLRGAHCLLAATYRVDAELMNEVPGLRLIQKTGTGTDNIDIEAAAARGIPVANTAGANATGVAELTMLFALALYRRLLDLDAGTKRGEWPMWAYRHRSFELSGKTHGIVGFGAIGQEVALRSKAFGTEIVYHDTVARTEAEAELGARRTTEISELLSASDVVSLHVPLLDETRNLVGEAELRQMKPEAVLINVSRGGVVDEAALYDALDRGQIAGAALDVWEREPIDSDDPLLGLSTVISTPHIGAGTRDTLERVLSMAFENISRLHSEDELRLVVNGVP